MEDEVGERTEKKKPRLSKREDAKTSRLAEDTSGLLSPDQLASLRARVYFELSEARILLYC